MRKLAQILLTGAALSLITGSIVTQPLVSSAEANSTDNKTSDTSKDKKPDKKKSTTNKKSDLGKAILDNDQIKVTLVRVSHDYVTEDSQNFLFFLKVENKTEGPLVVLNREIQLDGQDQDGITGFFSMEIDAGTSQEEHMDVSNALSGKPMPKMKGIMSFQMTVFPQNNSLAQKKYDVEINLDGLMLDKTAS